MQRVGRFLKGGWMIGARFVLVATLSVAAAAVGGEGRPEAGTGTLVVKLSGMKDDRGSLVYAMWAGPEGWLEKNMIREGSVPVVAGTSTLRFEQLPFGEYAISAYHDRNGNMKLDTGLFRIPKEPLGTSNDAKIRFGPPKYEDAAFTLDQSELAIEIPVRKLF
jgi:uncharacterized protein (DUF2141 family)